MTQSLIRYARQTAVALACVSAMIIAPSPARTADAPAPASRPAASAKDARDTVTVDADTEKVIKAALKYMAAKQTPTGAWTSPNGEHPVAVTGYTIMSFLACGQLPGEGEYGKQVTAGINYLTSCVNEKGYITSDRVTAAGGRKSSNMYDHGVAVIALAEVYGETQDTKLKEKLTSCIKLIVSAQGNEGGWRYTPEPRDADMSVTVLQVVALRACKNAGLDVPSSTIDSAVKYVKSCSDPRSGGFTYQPRNQAPGFARTAAAIYSLQVCGLYDDDLVKKGSKYLVDNTRNQNEYYTYGQFYAAPAQYMVGGDTWKKWYERIKAEVLPRVRKADDMAYWEQFDNGGVGTVYATAVYTMMLAMPYHYVPLYQR